MKKIIFSLILVLLSCCLTMAQCAMCKGAVQTNMSTGRDVIGNGINAGIAYLFIFPYLVVGVVAYLWYRNSKRALAQRLIVQARVREAMK